MTSSDIVGKKTWLKCIMTKPFAWEELIPGFWNKKSHPPRVIYITSLPRCGSTLAKRYLGDHPSLSIASMSASHNWWDAWCRQRLVSYWDKSVVDKRTLYIHHLKEIISNFGTHVKILLLIRDPRDQLISLLNFDRHKTIPRNKSFYDFWIKTYRKAFGILNNYSNAKHSSVLRYEDLVSKPTKIKELFLDWVGMEKINLKNTYSTADPTIARSENPDEDQKVHEKSKITKDSVGQWKKSDPDNLEIVEQYCDYEEVTKLMAELQYINGNQKKTKKLDRFELLDPGELYSNYEN